MPVSVASTLPARPSRFSHFSAVAERAGRLIGDLPASLVPPELGVSPQKDDLASVRIEESGLRIPGPALDWIRLVHHIGEQDWPGSPFITEIQAARIPASNARLVFSDAAAFHDAQNPVPFRRGGKDVIVPLSSFLYFSKVADAFTASADAIDILLTKLSDSVTATAPVPPPRGLPAKCPVVLNGDDSPALVNEHTVDPPSGAHTKSLKNW